VKRVVNIDFERAGHFACDKQKSHQINHTHVTLFCTRKTYVTSGIHQIHH